jgi:hypothetical protein
LKLEQLMDPVESVAAKVAKKATDLRARIRH